MCATWKDIDAEAANLGRRAPTYPATLPDSTPATSAAQIKAEELLDAMEGADDDGREQKEK